MAETPEQKAKRQAEYEAGKARDNASRARREQEQRDRDAAAARSAKQMADELAAKEAARLKAIEQMKKNEASDLKKPKGYMGR